jgi:DNA modification methylase
MINDDKKCNDLTGKEWLQNSFSIWRDLTKTKEEKELKHPATYPVALCEKLIKTFSKNGANVLDPFSGTGSTLVAAHNLGRYAVGIDLSTEFCDIAKNRVGQDDHITIINGDSFIEIDNLENDAFDLCVTSPPYWDILNMKRSADGKEPTNYSGKESDIGNIPNYKEFINSLGELFAKVNRVLKPEAYCLVNVMDIRKKSDFFPLHSDLATELQQHNYVFDDIIIWDRQQDYNNMRPLGYPYKYRINKVHEYILIFIKSKEERIMNESFLAFLQRSDQRFFIEAEAREDKMLEFISDYNSRHQAAITLETDGICLLGDVDKWGVELRIYFNDTHNIPAYWNSRKYLNKKYRSDQFQYRLDDNSLARYLFDNGYVIGYN